MNYKLSGKCSGVYCKCNDCKVDWRLFINRNNPFLKLINELQKNKSIKKEKVRNGK